MTCSQWHLIAKPVDRSNRPAAKPKVIISFALKPGSKR